MERNKRLIDANQTIAEMNRVETNRPYDDKEDILERCVNLLHTAHNVDAVEVVRCKDCKHCLRHTVPLGTYGYCNHFGYYDYAPEVQPDDFCSYGERREGE